MIIKTKPPIPNKPQSICARAEHKKVTPVRCTSGGELMVRVADPLPTVGDGVNRKNKDGVLVLGDDGQALRNVRVDPDGTMVVRSERPVVYESTEVVRTVKLDNPVDCKPITVTNIPDHIGIKGDIDVTQVPKKIRTLPFQFTGREFVAKLPSCRVYMIYFTISKKTFVEIPGVAGKMYLDEFKMSLFPMFISIDEFAIKTSEYVDVGGYIAYEG